MLFISTKIEKNVIKILLSICSARVVIKQSLAIDFSYLASLFVSHRHLKRLLSFNKLTNEPSPPSEPQEQLEPKSQDIRLTVMTNTLELESGSSPTHAETRQAESKHLAKLLNPVALAVAATDVVLYVNIPKTADGEHRIIYSAHIATTWLSFITSIGICTYPIICSSRVILIWAQKRLMLLAIGFTLVSFVLRSSMVLSISSLEYVILFFSVGAGLVLVCLCMAWKGEDYNQTAPNPANSPHDEDPSLV